MKNGFGRLESMIVMNKATVRNMIAWTLQIIFAVLFLLAASGKILSRPQVIEKFNGWGFPDGFYLIIGVLELLGAIGLLIPRLASYAASGLIIIMIGATLTHILNGEGIQVLRPLIFMLALGAVIFVRKSQTLKLRRNRENEQSV